MTNKLSAVQAEQLTVVPDGELVVRAQAGDARAFDELVQRQHGRIYRLARYLCGGHAENAEDSYQNALMNAYRHLAAFRGDSQFSTWLTRIVINECRLHRRRQRRERNCISLDERVSGVETGLPHDLAESSGSPEEEYARREFRAIFDRCLDSLPDLYRTGFVLREIECLSNQEIAARLGLSVPGARSRVSRARRQLQRCLQENFCRAGRCYWPGTGLSFGSSTTERGKERACSLSK